MGLAQQQPLLFLIEDAHWIDPTTLELIDFCLNTIRQLPVLLLIAYGAESLKPAPRDRGYLRRIGRTNFGHS